VFLSHDLLQCSEEVSVGCCKIKRYEEPEKIDLKVGVRRHKLTNTVSQAHKGYSEPLNTEKGNAE